MYGTGLIQSNTTSKIAILAFTSGAILNEAILAAQGIFGFSYTIIPFANEALFVIGFVMLASVVLLTLSFQKNTIDNNHHFV